MVDNIITINSVPEPNSGCWLWTGKFLKNRYGIIKDSQTPFKSKTKKWFAHRLSYRIHFGLIPNKLQVLHHCDTPACVNPKHLFLGTQKDNMADMKLKGRMIKRGSGNNGSI